MQLPIPVSGWLLLAAVGLMPLATACRRAPDGTMRLSGEAPAPPDRSDEPPVATDANSPVTYPASLRAQGVEGTVILRLVVDSAGKLLRDSTRIAESSGYPALDSAALAAAPRFHFAPALRKGAPAGTAFLQPIEFRNPARAELP